MLVQISVVFILGKHAQGFKIIVLSFLSRQANWKDLKGEKQMRLWYQRGQTVITELNRFSLEEMIGDKYDNFKLLKTLCKQRTVR